MKAPDVRPRWPFRRLAVVLSGGGALGAYQAGVLRVLEDAGLQPAIVIGLSVGAINAVAWTANHFRAAVLERTWSRIGPTSIGMRWTTLGARLVGVLLVAASGLEILLMIIGSHDIGLGLLVRRVPGGAGMPSFVFDLVAWLGVGAVGFAIAGAARQIEDLLARTSARAPAGTWRRWFGRALLAAMVLHFGAWIFGWPWPHRFSASAIVLGGIVWLLQRGGRTSAWLRHTRVRLLPESGGRGLWRGLARQRLLEQLVAEGEPRRLTDGSVHLMVNAVALDSGRMCYFINWRDPSPHFRDALARDFADVRVLTRPEEIIEAATASSALPVLFRPVDIAGHAYVDAGMFSSRAVSAAIADGADAVLVVLMSPVLLPHSRPGDRHLIEIAGRLLELGNWRDLRTELQTLPESWTRPSHPARLCVVEPRDPLAGGMLHFDPRDALGLMQRGREDARAALEAAGWLIAAAPGGAPRG